MRCQIEKNKEILCDEIEKLSEQKMNTANAEKLSMYRGAYKALCMASRKNNAEYTTGWSETDASSSFMGRNYMHTDVTTVTTAEVSAWVGSMENADGTHGGHWTMEATEQVRKKLNIDCDPAAFYAAMNMMYSDYSKVAEKFSASTPDFYACMAKAFLDDKDAKPHKLARYYRYIVEK